MLYVPADPREVLEPEGPRMLIGADAVVVWIFVGVPPTCDEIYVCAKLLLREDKELDAELF